MVQRLPVQTRRTRAEHVLQEQNAPIQGAARDRGFGMAKPRRLSPTRGVSSLAEASHRR